MLKNLKIKVSFCVHRVDILTLYKNVIFWEKVKSLDSQGFTRYSQFLNNTISAK